MLTWLLCLFPLAVLGQFDSNSNGGPIVHLFQWKWTDIANECENFLSKHQFGGVQISPPNEYVVVDTPDVLPRPWWEVYQPVSYNLTTRFGNEQEFKDMVNRCNNVGVRIYVDAVINHMSGKVNMGTEGTAGSSFDGESQEYPDYSRQHFNDDKCRSSSGDVENFKDANEVRDCKLLGLNDLDLSDSHVRETITGYLNRLIDSGVAGFRIDAAKHMHPEDLKVILSNLNNLNTDFFESGAKPFIYNEVIDLGDEAVSASEYFDLGLTTEFKYCDFIGKAFKGSDGMNLADLKQITQEDGFVPDNRAFIFVDNHDNQRGHGAHGEILNYKNGKMYKSAVAFTLAHPYGYKRIMSSYDFEDTDMGPPRNSFYEITGPTFKDDGLCSGGWVCEHRWPSTYAMVDFADAVNGTELENWWDNEANQVAFSRGTRGFVAFNNGEKNFSQTLQTGLPAGTYCDVVTGGLSDQSCAGMSITVSSDGMASIEIPADHENDFVAFHVNAML